VVGRDSDIQIVRYFFNYLHNEIERLCKQQMASGFGEGKTWSNNFKHGAVAVISERLKQAKKEVLNYSSNCQAMIRLSIKDEEVQKWVKDNLKLKNAARSYARNDEDGYHAGRRAGAGINLSKGIGGKSSANKLLG
jgi:post-segregation antitoxin (ccd killing protein)